MAMKKMITVLLCFNVVLAVAGSEPVSAKSEAKFVCPTLNELLKSKKPEDKTRNCPTLEQLANQKIEENRKEDLRLHAEIVELRKDLLKKKIQSFQMFPDP